MELKKQKNEISQQHLKVRQRFVATTAWWAPLARFKLAVLMYRSLPWTAPPYILDERYRSDSLRDPELSLKNTFKRQLTTQDIHFAKLTTKYIEHITDYFFSRRYINILTLYFTVVLCTIFNWYSVTVMTD